MKNIIINTTITGNHDGSNQGNPVPKPRMVNSDKWKKRPCVLRYRAYADWLRDQLFCVVISEEGSEPPYLTEDCTNWMGAVATRIKLNQAPFTSSKQVRWGIKLWIGLRGDRRGDTDNIIKAIKDILFQEDKDVFVYLQEGSPELIPLKSDQRPYLRMEMVRVEKEIKITKIDFDKKRVEFINDGAPGRAAWAIEKITAKSCMIQVAGTVVHSESPEIVDVIKNEIRAHYKKKQRKRVVVAYFKVWKSRP